MPILLKLAFLLGFPFILLMSVATSDESARTIVTSNLRPGYIVIFLMGGLAILGLLEVYMMLRAAPHMTHTDISHELRPIPKSARPYLSSLEEWGFIYLGQALRRMPNKPKKIVWVFTRADGYITAEITESKDRANVEFDTFFVDLALLETSVSKGKPITLPDYRCITGFTGLTGLHEAYREHQEVASEMMQTHGRPIPVQTLQAYLNASKVFPERHAVPTLKIILRRMAIEAVPFLYLVGWLGLMVALILRMDGYKPIIGYVMGILILPVAATALVPKEERMW